MLQASKYTCTVIPCVTFSLENILYIPQLTWVCYGDLKKKKGYTLSHTEFICPTLVSTLINDVIHLPVLSY